MIKLISLEAQTLLFLLNTIYEYLKLQLSVICLI